MASYPPLINKAIEELCKLPGIGHRSAERIVFYLLQRTKDEVKQLAAALFYMRDKLNFCQRCNNFAEGQYCRICMDENRDKSVVCVVEKPSDVIVIEKAGCFNGMYYVLLGSLSPLDEEGQKRIEVDKLLSWIEEGQVKEVIIATDADEEGEMTAVFLQDLLRQYPVVVSRIGIGIPVGANIEYVDTTTLSWAITSRKLVGKTK